MILPQVNPCRALVLILSPGSHDDGLWEVVLPLDGLDVLRCKGAQQGDPGSSLFSKGARTMLLVPRAQFQ